MLKNTINIGKASVAIVAFLVFVLFNDVQASELKVSDSGSDYQTAASSSDSVQPAEDVIYGERLRTDSSISVGSTGYFYQGFHTNGVIFANNTIVNSSLNDDSTGIPVTFGDDARIDGEIWRGSSKGTSDNMPLKFSDTLMPTMNNINDIGTSSNYWRHGYFSGNVAVGNISGENVISEENLNVSNSPTSGYVLAYGSDGQFTWTPISGSSDDNSNDSILPSGTANQTLRYSSNGWEASSLIHNDGTDIDIGGGFGDSGVTIYGAGGINANGSLSASSLTTSGMLTVGGVAGISGNLIASNNISVGGQADFGGGWSSSGSGVSIESDGDIRANGELYVNSHASIGAGYNNSDGGATITDVGYMILQGTFGSAPGITMPAGSGTKMIWYPGKAAFRAGHVTGTEWDDSNIGDYSLATGYDSTASGQGSIASGMTATASANGSIAIGSGAQAVGTNSTSIGFNNIATGANSVAMGYRAKADADADQSFIWAGDSECGIGDDSCDLDVDHVFAIVGGLCVEDEGGDAADCPDGDYDGQIIADGAITATGFDLAERIDSSEVLEAGDVVITDYNNNEQILKSKESYDSSVIGVVSTDPGNILGWENTGNSLLALAGRIPTKVNNENGNIEIGDLLTTSSQEGYAMKYSLLNPEDASDFDELKSILKENEERRNSILGKALEPCNQEECKIVTLLSLQ